jgi:hypothetical protein
VGHLVVVEGSLGLAVGIRDLLLLWALMMLGMMGVLLMVRRRRVVQGVIMLGAAGLRIRRRWRETTG